VKGFSEAIRKSPGKKVFVCNLMTQIGNTDGFGVEDFLGILEKYLGKGAIDYIIFNTGRLSPEKMKKVKKIFPGADFIKYDKTLLKNKKFIAADILNCNIHDLNPKDTLVRDAKQRKMVLHDQEKLAKIILSLCPRQ